MFDSYTVKKVLPRLFVAVILIQLSWFIFTGMIAITNSIAIGIESLIYAPFGGAKGLELQDILASTSGGNGMFIGLTFFGLAAGILGVLAVGGVLATAIMALLGVLIAFAMLLARQVIIVALLLIAPLALVAWILPGTEKYWKMWWESFFKLLLVFPMIVALIATGRVLALVVTGVDPNSSTIPVIDDIITFFLLIVCIFGPFYMIPKTFQLAGGIFQTLTGTINNKSRGVFDRLRNSRQKTQAKNWDATKSGKRFKSDSALSRRANSAMMSATLAGSAGIDPRKWRARTRAARSERISQLSGKAGESAAAQMVAGNDDLLAAALNGNGSEEEARAYLQSIGQRGRELDQNVASIVRAKQDMGKTAFEDFAASALAGTGTGYAGGPAEMLNTINRVAGSDSSRAARILASARSQAEKARRVDLYGAGFAVSADQMAQLRNGTTTDDAVNETMTDEALNSKSGAEIAYSRNNAVKNMSGAVVRRLARANMQVDAARQTGDRQLIETAEHVQKQAFAATSAFLDTAGSVSPENAQVIGAIMGQTQQMVIKDPSRNTYDDQGNLVSSGVRRVSTVGEAIEALESDSEYKQYKKTYQSEYQATTAAQQLSQRNNQGPPGPPGPPTF